MVCTLSRASMACPLHAGVGLRSRWARVWACGLVLMGAGAAHHGAVFAATALSTVAVQCTLQSTRLHFGTLTMSTMHRVPGQGEILVACQNPSPMVQWVDLSVSQMASGRGAVTLQPQKAGLKAEFFLDAQATLPWGDGTQGTRSLQMRVRLDPGAYQVFRLPVHALLYRPVDAPAGVYGANMHLTMTCSTPE